ncbi:MAG: zinc/manganese transport system substrate-binding protein [Gaiellales bacterium]|nr:zinc/manganese transport system substrate-binding protein [Gaiellales bacterium]
MRTGLIRVALLATLALTTTTVGVASVGAASSGGSDLQVVAAENFWGSIAAQLGGNRVHVTSVIANPATDPHGYEPSAADARTMAGAKMAIVNGVGYDPWADKLIAANPVDGREVLEVGDLVGIKPGGNPHRWYSPSDVHKVIREIVRDFTKLDPKGAAYFKQQEANFETRGLGQYKQLIATIKRRYHGVEVGASESIFTPLAQALGLHLATPYSFLKAISEGTDPTASDKTTIDRQIAARQIKVWVFNSQNSTPDVQRITDAARKKGIPVATITETLPPASASFQAWQVRELQTLAAALAKATGR